MVTCPVHITTGQWTRYVIRGVAVALLSAALGARPWVSEVRDSRVIESSLDDFSPSMRATLGTSYAVVIACLFLVSMFEWSMAHSPETNLRLITHGTRIVGVVCWLVFAVSVIVVDDEYIVKARRYIYFSNVVALCTVLSGVCIAAAELFPVSVGERRVNVDVHTVQTPVAQSFAHTIKKPQVISHTQNIAVPPSTRRSAFTI